MSTIFFYIDGNSAYLKSGTGVICVEFKASSTLVDLMGGVFRSGVPWCGCDASKSESTKKCKE